MGAGRVDHVLRVLRFQLTHVRFNESGAYGHHPDPLCRILMRTFLRVPHDKVLAHRVRQPGFVVFARREISFSHHMLHEFIFPVFRHLIDLVLYEEAGSLIGGAGSDVHNDAPVVHILIELHVHVLRSDGVDQDDLLRICHSGRQTRGVNDRLYGPEAGCKQTELMNILSARHITGDQVDFMPFRLQDRFRLFKLRNCPSCQDQDHFLINKSCCSETHSASAAGNHAYICHIFLPPLIPFSLFFDDSFIKKPLDLIMDRLFIGPRPVSQFFLCLAGIKYVVSCQIIDTECRHDRLFA